MSVTILEALQNVEHNMQQAFNLIGPLGIIAKEQQDNAIVRLEKGYDPMEEVEPLLEE